MFLQFSISVIVHNLDDSLREQTGLNENHGHIIRHWRRCVNRVYETDEFTVGVPRKRRPSVRQGEGRDAVVTGDVSIKGIAQDTESEVGEVLGVVRMEFVDAPVLESFRRAYVVYAPPREVL